MEAVADVMEELFPMSHIVRIPCTDISTTARSYNARSKFSFVGGTNILSNDILHNSQWDINLHNLYILKDIILMGCGWFQYEERPVKLITKYGLNRILSKKYIHSTRDGYTRDKLESIGIRAINTGCPTLWKITPSIVERISCAPKEKVILTLTDYNRDRERDLKLLKICESVYPKGMLYFPQGTDDIAYLKELGYADKVTILPPRLRALDKALANGECDYVGTRLHAGIRALQNSVRAFIVGVDNRSIEMGRDFSLPILNLDSIANWHNIISGAYKLDLTIPYRNIALWKNQFQ